MPTPMAGKAEHSCCIILTKIVLKTKVINRNKWRSSSKTEISDDNCEKQLYKKAVPTPFLRRDCKPKNEKVYKNI